MLKKLIGETMKINLKDMVNTHSRRMSPDEVSREIKYYMKCRQPKKIVMTLERNEKIGGFYSEIYITKDSEKPYI